MDGTVGVLLGRFPEVESEKTKNPTVYTEYQFSMNLKMKLTSAVFPEKRSQND